jgi:hypothetical protein
MPSAGPKVLIYWFWYRAYQSVSISFNMRWIHLPLSLLLALTLTAAPNHSEDAIRQLVQQYLNARDQNNARALRNLFVPDADQLVSSGEWRKGRDALVTGTLQSSQRTVP